MKLTRTEKWPLAPTAHERQVLRDTIALYQRYVRAVATVCFTHWPELGSLEGHRATQAMEALIHPTRYRPRVKYPYFSRMFYKFPSYLRRSAIMDAVGQVRSFLNRYDQWQTAALRHSRTARPPRFGQSNSAPSLYKGQCIKYADDLSSAEIKVFQDNDWKWLRIRIKRVGRRARDINQKRAAPLLVVTRKTAMLAVPFEQEVALASREADVVCAVDLGINTSVTASIVRSDGTVLARRFLHRPSDNDRLHKRLAMIQAAARKTRRLTGGFAAKWERKARHIAKESAHRLARALVDFAESHGATTLVFERLKGWRPRAPRRSLRQRFHSWLHRRIVQFAEWKWREKGGRLAFVSPAGTSRFAYDGSGRVSRDVQGSHSLCRFTTGKVYHADLNATYNIAAKFLLRRREADQLGAGQCPAPKPRTPVTLSLLWALHRPEQCEA